MTSDQPDPRHGDVDDDIRRADRANGEPGTTGPETKPTQVDEHGEPIPPMAARPGPVTEREAESEEDRP